MNNLPCHLFGRDVIPSSEMLKNLCCQEHYEFVRMENMKNKEKISASLRRSAISLIVWVAIVITSAAITGSAYGQLLGISGSEEVAAGRWQRLVNQPPFDTDSANL